MMLSTIEFSSPPQLPPPKPPTLEIYLQNRSKSPVFAYITGYQDDGNFCFITRDGYPYVQKHLSKTTPRIEIPSCLISIALPAKLTIPSLRSGRIWFSIRKHLIFGYNPRHPLRYVLPNPLYRNDPNYHTQFDFVDFTFTDGILHSGLDYTDFISLPISLYLRPEIGRPQEVKGLKPDALKTVVEGLKAQSDRDSSEWWKLVKFHRVLSPKAAIQMERTIFAGYYDNYVKRVWEKYHFLALEIKTRTKWGTMTGFTNTKTGNIEFHEQLKADTKLYFHEFAPPTSADIFSCDTGPFANSHPRPLESVRTYLIGIIAAALNRSTLADSNDQPDGQKPQKFYQDQITNHYARLVHESCYDERCKAFPYDGVWPDEGAGGLAEVYGKPLYFSVHVG